MQAQPNLYSLRNEAVRFHIWTEIDPEDKPSLTTFFRRADLPHVWNELIAPTFPQEQALLVAATDDLPLPPWGVGAQKIVALCYVHPIGETDASLTNVLTLDEDATNIGLMTALFRETLLQLQNRDKTEVSFVVVENSVLAHRVLSANGFTRTPVVFLTEHARYYLYQGRIADVLAKLGLAEIYAHDLLAHNVEDSLFERNALFQAMLQLSMRPFWADRTPIPEVIANTGMATTSLPPGGVGGTPGPTDQ